MLETQRLTEERQHRKAALNIIVSLVLGVAAAELGRLIGRAPVNEDAVKLTSYFGERRRVAGGRFAADALLDLYGRHEVATSILLRGAEGFGAKRHPRTDMSLTLSEDLPLIAVAVDSRSRIEPLVEPTARLTGTGLVTLEGARLLSGDIEPGDVEAVTLREGAHEETKLTVYVGRQERVYRMPAFMAVCDLLHRRGVAGATALLGVDGTAHGHRERASFFSRNAGTPMMVIAVGSGTRIARVLPELAGCCAGRCSRWSASGSASGTGSCCARPPPCPARTRAACRCGTSSWSTRPRPHCTTASRSTGRSSAGCSPRGSAARPPSGASGASTATTRRTATACCSSAGTSPSSRS